MARWVLGIPKVVQIPQHGDVGEYAMPEGCLQYVRSLKRWKVWSREWVTATMRQKRRIDEAPGYPNALLAEGAYWAWELTRVGLDRPYQKVARAVEQLLAVHTLLMPQLQQPSLQEYALEVLKQHNMMRNMQERLQVVLMRQQMQQQQMQQQQQQHFMAQQQMQLQLGRWQSQRQVQPGPGQGFNPLGQGYIMPQSLRNNNWPLQQHSGTSARFQDSQPHMLQASQLCSLQPNQGPAALQGRNHRYPQPAMNNSPHRTAGQRLQVPGAEPLSGHGRRTGQSPHSRAQQQQQEEEEANELLSLLAEEDSHDPELSSHLDRLLGLGAAGAGGGPEREEGDANGADDEMEEGPESEGFEDMPGTESSDQEMAGAEAPPGQHGAGGVEGGGEEAGDLRQADGADEDPPLLPPPEPAAQEVQQPAQPEQDMWMAAMCDSDGTLELDLAPGAAALVQEHTQATRDLSAQMEAMRQQMQQWAELQASAGYQGYAGAQYDEGQEQEEVDYEDQPYGLEDADDYAEDGEQQQGKPEDEHEEQQPAQQEGDQEEQQEYDDDRQQQVGFLGGGLGAMDMQQDLDVDPRDQDAQPFWDMYAYAQ